MWDCWSTSLTALPFNYSSTSGVRDWGSTSLTALPFNFSSTSGVHAQRMIIYFPTEAPRNIRFPLTLWPDRYSAIAPILLLNWFAFLGKATPKNIQQFSHGVPKTGVPNSSKVTFPKPDKWRDDLFLNQIIPGSFLMSSDFSTPSTNYLKTTGGTHENPHASSHVSLQECRPPSSLNITRLHLPLKALTFICKKWKE